MTALSISASRTEMPPSRHSKKRCVSTHPVVFHTGFHAWGGNRPERCHSEDLTGLVSSLPKTDFLLLHSGIPFLDEAITLAAYYPNVHLSMAWMHIIDRRKSV
jgi:predicted TIM-barrel fold metal-dependent hydrolase